MRNDSSKDADSVRRDVQDYYGKRIKTTDDLQTSVCTVGRRGMPAYLREAMALVHPEVQSKYYGCGLIAPTAMGGCSVLDLGSGAGMDCFVLSKLVGENGHVTGMDMTDEQLEVARKFSDYHAKQFGYSAPNTDFVKGYMEQLTDAGLQESTYDVIVSNCVINLSPDKKKVLSEAFKVLKPGGELFFSDVYSDSVLPEEIRKHTDLWGECIAGALSWEDLNSFSKESGFCQPRLVTASSFNFKESSLTDIVAGFDFVSATYRLFKLSRDARQRASTVTYNGQLAHHAAELVFDHKYTFKTGVPQVVDAELTAILENSRYKEFFTIQDGDAEAPCCVKVNPFTVAADDKSTSGGCC